MCKILAGLNMYNEMLVADARSVALALKGMAWHGLGGALELNGMALVAWVALALVLNWMARVARAAWAWSVMALLIGMALST